MGGKVSEAEVRDLLGLSQPKEDEAVLGGGGANPLDAILGQTAAQEGAEPAPDAPKTFRRTRWL